MKSLLALLLIPVAVVPAQPADPHVVMRRVTVAPVAVPQEFTVACRAGERVLGGGYARATDDEVQVTSSYPAEAGWSVRVFNTAKVARALEISVTCGTVPSIVASAPGTSIQCPSGTVATGGGYLSEWLPRQGGAAISGSYPATPEGWAVDIVQLPPAPDVRAGAEVKVFAVCASGVERAGATPKTLDVPAGTPVCADADVVFAPTCTWPRTGSDMVSCSDHLVGGGYQVTAGKLPNYSVLTAAASQDSWQLSLNGRSDDSRPLSLRLTPMCVTFLTIESADPVAGRDETLPIIVFVGAGLLIFLVLIMVTRRGGSRRPAQHEQVAVVLRAHRGTFRLEELREVQ